MEIYRLKLDGSQQAAGIFRTNWEWSGRCVKRKLHCPENYWSDNRCFSVFKGSCEVVPNNLISLSFNACCYNNISLHHDFTACLSYKRFRINKLHIVSGSSVQLYLSSRTCSILSICITLGLFFMFGRLVIDTDTFMSPHWKEYIPLPGTMHIH